MISKSVSSFLALSLGLYLVFGRCFFPYLTGLFLLAFFATEKRYRWIYITWKTLPRDLKAAYRFIGLNLKLLYWENNKSSVIDAFSERVQKHPDKIAFLFEDKTWTFKQVDDYSDKVAALLLSQGLKPGECVALFMENRPEYVGIWLGSAKIGCPTALINTNLTKKPLEHCLKAANCSLILFSAELETAIYDLNWKETPLLRLDLEAKASEIPANVDNAKDVTKSLKEIAPLPVHQRYHSNPTDRLIYIYTSGTTGLPKAAVIKHTRFLFMQWGVKTMLGVQEEDRLYNSLPFYHTAGGILGVGQVIIGGSSMAIRRKFSVTNFWKDCVKYDCTIGQYIGEICRYLLSGKPCDEERQHRIRLVYGNGMRPQIWRQFVNRFGIKQVGEFYGSTEGNSNLVNIDGKEGAVGFIPRLAVKFYPVSLIRVDEHTLEPIRGPDGLCIRCQPGEPGIFVGKINPKKSYQDFEGYADKSASEKKILQNVFITGDSAFNSGDVLVMDELGYYYFRDRTGDTFRWRGENVSTAEVEAVISNIISLKDSVVYGVEIPNVEGRAGMAAIVDPQNSLDLSALAEGVRRELPSYSRPLFIRVMAELPMTSTFKMKKIDLQEEGFNIHKVQDPLYYLNARGVYEPITNEIYGDIISGKIRI